ncbi:MAG: mechanosensitive ion channel family protein, partial [Lysobacteraceae bacterium]
MAAPFPVPASSPVDAAGMLAQLQSRLAHADWIGLLEVWGLRLLSALVILAAGLWLSRKVSKALERALLRANVDPMLGSFLR